MDRQAIVVELKQERDRLSVAIAALEGQSPKAGGHRAAGSGPATPGKRKAPGLTAAGRKRLSDIMKKRWVEARKKGAKGHLYRHHR
jgi:hypothetical protein